MWPDIALKFTIILLSMGKKLRLNIHEQLSLSFLINRMFTIRVSIMNRYITFKQRYSSFYNFYLLIHNSTNYSLSTFNLLRSNKYRSMHLSIVTVAYATRWQSDILSIALEIEFLYPISWYQDIFLE